MHCTWPGLADLRTGQDSVTGSSIDMYGGMEQRTVLSFTAAVLDWCIQPRLGTASAALHRSVVCF